MAHSACPGYRAMSKNRGSPVTKSVLCLLNTAGLGCIQKHNDQAQVIRAHCAEVLSRMRERERELNEASRTLFEKALLGHARQHGWDDDALLDELFLFFLAGHETTATALSWMLFEIVANDLQAKCADAAKNYYNKMNQRYLKAVLHESLRMNTVVSRPLLRKSDTEVPDSDAEITVGKSTTPITYEMPLENGKTVEVEFPGGTNFLVNLHALHHCDAWLDSTRFDPARFLDQPLNMLEELKFAPFSFGPRDCIGKPMAMREMTVVLRDVLAKFEFCIADDNLAHLVADENLEEARNSLRSSDLTMRPQNLRMFVKVVDEVSWV